MNTDFKEIEKIFNDNGWFLESRIGSSCFFTKRSDSEISVVFNCDKVTSSCQIDEFLDNIIRLSSNR